MDGTQGEKHAFPAIGDVHVYRGTVMACEDVPPVEIGGAPRAKVTISAPIDAGTVSVTDTGSAATHKVPVGTPAKLAVSSTRTTLAAGIPGVLLKGYDRNSWFIDVLPREVKKIADYRKDSGGTYRLYPKAFKDTGHLPGSLVFADEPELVVLFVQGINLACAIVPGLLSFIAFTGKNPIPLMGLICAAIACVFLYFFQYIAFYKLRNWLKVRNLAEKTYATADRIVRDLKHLVTEGH